MRSRLLTLHPNHEELRQSRSDSDDKSHRPKASLKTLLRVNIAELSPVTDLMLDNLFPPNFGVFKQLILKYSPNFMEDLPMDHLCEYRTRYDCALRSELLGMIYGPVVTDNCWTERVPLIPDSTFGLLCKTS